MAESRRTFTREFKVAAVKLATEKGRSVSEAARSLGISAERLRHPEKRVGPRRRLRHPATRPRRASSSPSSPSTTAFAGSRLSATARRRLSKRRIPITFNPASTFRGELQTFVAGKLI